MAQFFEFVSNHLLLVGTFVALLIAFFINESKRGGAAISAQNLVRLFNQGEAVILDIRDEKEFRQGHITGSISIPYGSLDSRVAELDKYKEKTIVIVCKMGQHAGAAGRKLKELGYLDVKRLTGGLAEWSALSMPLVKK
ncbi:MAG: rhodanese-like domain-containing protein [Gammaproteobacteria bacterium]|nr:rhodanese-like domain-containing protein [Gammaproteobacteria bacterium]